MTTPYELDDIWLEKMEKFENLSIEQKRRLYRVIMVLAVGVSYVIDALLLFLFGAAGTISFSVSAVYAGLGMMHIILFSVLHWSGFSDRFANPHMTVWQILFAILVQIIGMIMAPKLMAFFMAVMFIVFSFGVLRISFRHLLLLWFFGCFAIASSLYVFTPADLGIDSPTHFELSLILISFAAILLRTVSLGHYASTLRFKMLENTRSLQKEAYYDPLTGALNRRVVLPSIDRLLGLSERKEIPFCIIMFDIDHFKSVNDTFGHRVGDQVLKHIVEFTSSCIRNTDLLGRYGGEEFILLLPATMPDEGYALAERIRQGIEKIDWNATAPGMSITVSCGITSVRAKTEDDPVKQADHALYDAKAAGRNRVCIYQNV